MRIERLPARAEKFSAGRIIFKRKWAVRFVLFLLTFLLVTASGLPVSAAFEAIVARCSDGAYYQYDYRELIDSYARILLGSADPLYVHFASKSAYAFLSDDGRYLDYRAMIDYYALTLLESRRFDLENYLESDSARAADMPFYLATVKCSDGRLNKEVEKVRTGFAGDVSAGNASPGEMAVKPTVLQSLFLISSPTISVNRARQWAAGREADQRFIIIASHYWHYASLTGINPEVLYAQAALETNFGHYTGIVPPEYNNWAGIKTAAAGGDRLEDHERFATAEEGVRAHFNHISAYVGLEPIGLPHGRYFVVLGLPWAGTVKTVEELSGKWAPSSTYHERILLYLNEMQ